MGITGLLWKAIVSLYENVVSSVLYRGFRSDVFSVNVGTRQGGVSSPFLYLCYIDRLLQDLELRFSSFMVNEYPVPCIASADAMVLMSLTKNGLDRMMQFFFIILVNGDTNLML